MAMKSHVDEKAAKGKNKVPSKSASSDYTSSTRFVSNSASMISRVHSDYGIIVIIYNDSGESVNIMRPLRGSAHLKKLILITDMSMLAKKKKIK